MPSEWRAEAPDALAEGEEAAGSAHLWMGWREAGEGRAFSAWRAHSRGGGGAGRAGGQRTGARGGFEERAAKVRAGRERP